MQASFWLEKWQKGETGFHQEAVNPYLERYWPELRLPAGSGVFVPLCGKSRDMLWLRDLGHAVTGVELSEIAVEGFFSENNLKPRHSGEGKFKVAETEGIRILCGDFFDIAASDLQKAKGVFDRAALIALPPEMRRKYARHLAKILPGGAQILLVTLEYPQEEMTGPPFSVPAEEVEALFKDGFSIRQLERADIFAHDRLAQRGLSRLQENVFLLVKTA